MQVRLPLAVASAVAGLTLALLPRQAFAQREVLNPMGAKGTLAIDDLSGFRMGSVGTGNPGVNYGVSYTGILGFSVQSVGENDFNTGVTTTAHYTSIWIAPSADYFVIDHLSVGGLLAIESTSASLDVPTGAGNATTTFNLPGTTSITFLPRVGWLFGISDRFGIWPRLGVGYGSHAQTILNGANPGNSTTDTFSTFLVDVDVGFLYRITENWFLRGAPELTLAPGSHSQTIANVSRSAGESLTQFGIVGGIGVMWDL
jgi:hypothetical protein